MNKYNSIKKACEISDEIFCLILSNFENFETEKDIEYFIKKEIKRRNYKLSFKPIVASGKNAADPHHKPTTKKLIKGFCVIDLGVKVNDFCSDCTRTFYIGKASKKEKLLYKKVLRVQKESIRNIKNIKKPCELDLKARKQLGKNLLHSLGHGIGKRVHEAPKIGPKNKRFFKKNVFITIEPGYYVKNKFGIRIEDTIYVGNQIKVLTKFTKNLREVQI